MKLSHVALLTFGVVAVAAPVLAHHSFAEYDDKTRVTITGTLKSLNFVNPHIGYELDVRNKKGKVETWKVAGPAPSAWRAAGWVKSDFAIGEEMTLTGFPKREDPHWLSTNVLKNSKGKVYGQEMKIGG